MSLLPEDSVSGDAIDRIETYCLELPYRFPVHFSSVTESCGQYFLLRLITRDGAEGFAECIARKAQSGEDPGMIAREIETDLAPLIMGADPLGHMAILEGVLKAAVSRTAQALIDTALWDVKGKLLGQPVWRLLGCDKPERVPVAWIAHGDTPDAMINQAVHAVGEGGFSALKIKTWRRSMEDVEMVGAIRRAVGDDRIMWVDANSTYTEDEALAVFPHMAAHDISFIEEPCKFPDLGRMAEMACALPVPLLGDQTCKSYDAVQKLAGAGAIRAASVKLRRTGITESLRVIEFCEGAGLPVMIGTDSESRIGALARIHLRTAIPSLSPWPTETHFFRKLADDVFEGDFDFVDGGVLPGNAPGFGAAVDWKKLEKYKM